MLTDILYLIGGIILLIAGGNYLTDGAVAVARRFHVSSLMIGLTVVALGSSMPDIAVCVESALEHKTAIAVGDIIGADIFDLLLVVGLMGLCHPWQVSRMMMRRDVPLLILSVISLWIVADTIIFDGTAHNVIDRSAGLMLLVVFIFYMWLMVEGARRDDVAAAQSSPAGAAHGVASAHIAKGEGKGTAAAQRPWLSWTMIIGGLIALVIGGDWVVDGASDIARRAGMSQGMVALTVVAVGNSLPDIVTSLTASLKGQPGLAFGNIVGACIIDALLAIGISSAITPLDSGTVGFFDFMTLVGAAILVWILPMFSRTRTLGRPAGALLTLLYIAYMVLVIIRA